IPGNPNPGRTCGRIVELVDMHRTLADVCGIAADAKTEGASLRPLLENPEVAWDRPAFSQVTRGGAKQGKSIMGRSLRTERWRYTEWDEGRAGVELYDHDADPQEMRNLAADAASAEIAAAM